MKKSLLIIFVITTIWSAINPYEVFTWWLEASPALIGLLLLIVTYKKFKFTNMVYIFLTIHAVILLIGAHYTYAEVPAFSWLRDEFDLSRNHYDRFAHFAQGFIPALVARELLVRTSPLKPGKWLFAVTSLGCLGISAAYELIEWGVSVNVGEEGDSFLGTQGDIWDTQKDMALALLGAMLAQILLGRKHDRALKKIGA